MPRRIWLLALLVVLASIAAAHAQEKTGVAALLGREIIGPQLGLTEVQAFIEPRVPPPPEPKSLAEWEKQAAKLRADLLDRVVFRGEAAVWRKAPCQVVWLDVLPGGPGYRIRKLRYEALPGLWIPALLYEPEKLTGKVPVGLAVNGHDGNGKAAPYKQVRCINQAKRGMLVLNVEWLGMGQLRSTGFQHYRMNQLDLCGTSGLAPFYLAMSRALDLLLRHEHADPERVAVSGLSGGGWQTIYISALDTRVKLANPVAGYSGFRTRVRHLKDLGDSEQTPCDMATVADYTHLTALLAPRATLLTYCARDNCCFEAGYALPPLLEAAAPVFKLYDHMANLRSHINHDPGTHNYEKDNRQAFYRILRDVFFAGSAAASAEEIPSDQEVKTADELRVDLPEKNADFQTLALALSKDLPQVPPLPASAEAGRAWQRALRGKLRDVVRTHDYSARAEQVGEATEQGTRAIFWKVRLGDAWTVPVTELVRGQPKGTTVLVNDAGRKADPVNAERLLAAGQRVLAVDPFYFGESRIAQRDHLFALLVAAVGERPLGIQASQLAALARWSVAQHQGGPVTLVAVGPRSSTFALVAASLEEKAIAGVELHGALGSLKEVIEQNRSVDQMPEMFCFGLLQTCDVKQLTALAAPRPVAFVAASPRAKTELQELKAWYSLLGQEYEPLR